MTPANGQPSARSKIYAANPEERALDDVLGLGDAIEHAVCDRERHRAQLPKHLVASATHASSRANPTRQLESRGCQPSSRLALSLEAPRTSVIITVAASPATRRPSHRGTR